MGISALLAAQILDASATGRSVITGADASAIRSTLGLGTLATQSPTGTPSASTFLRGDFSWQTIDLSGYVPYSGATGAVNLGSNAFTASQATLSAGTLNGTVLDIAQTWGGTGTYTGIKYNVTDSGPANAASLLMDLQVGGTSKFKVDKIGAITIGGTTGRATFVLSDLGAGQYTNLFGDNTNYLVIRSAASTNSFYFNGSTSNGPGFTVASNLNIAWGSSTNAANTQDLILSRDAADTLAQRRSTNAQTFRLYNTFTDASNYERAKIAWESNVLVIGTEAAGTGIGTDIRIRTNSGNSLTLSNGGNLTMNSSLWLSWSSRVILESPGFGILRISDSNRTGFERLQLGGTTSSFPAIKRNAAALNFRLADDSADCDITAKAATFSGNVTVSAVNLVTDTTTGTKIGTATTQKLGLWNATPIVQPTTAVDSATVSSPGGGSTIKTDDTFDGYTIQQVVKALRNFGLLA